MKVLIIRNSPTIVNFDNYNLQEIGLAKALYGKGCEVGIIFYTDGEYREETKDGIKIYHMPGRKFLNHGIYGDAAFQLMEYYDVIQTAEYNQIMSYQIVKRYPEKAVIYHGPYFSTNILTIINNMVFDLFFLKKYRRLNPMIMTKSELAKDFLIKKRFQRVTVTGVGLNADQFVQDHGETCSVKFDERKKNILVIGTIEERKNIIFVLEILQQLLKTDTSYHLYLIGKPKQGYKKKCNRLIQKYGMQENITFIDNMNQNTLPYVYTNGHIMLLASKYEIFGMVLLEAAYYKMPVLSTLNGGASFLLKDAQIIDNYDVDQWCTRIMEYRENLKVYKRDRILWSDIVQGFLDAYSSVCDYRNQLS